MELRAKDRRIAPFHRIPSQGSENELLFTEFLLCDCVLKPRMNVTEISHSWKWEEETVLVAVLAVICSRGKYDSRNHKATG